MAVERQFDGLPYDRAVQRMLYDAHAQHAVEADAVYAAVVAHAQLERCSELVDTLLRRLPTIARRSHVQSDRCLAKCWRCLGHLLPCRLESAIAHLSDLTHPEHAALALTVRPRQQEMMMNSSGITHYPANSLTAPPPKSISA